MSEYVITVGSMECDYFCQLPPRRILEHCLDVTLTELERDGCGAAVLEERFHAVWMISHTRFTQSAPIYPNDVLTLRTRPRMEKPSCIFYYCDVVRGEEPVVQWECTYIVVNRISRHLLRTGVLAPLWTAPAQETRPSTLHRLRPGCVFTPCGSDTVRLSDCDKNRHMTSGAYLSLACDALGFWDSDTPRLMRCVQVDYSSEVYPDTLLHFERGETDSTHFVRGIKPDGKIAFTAACDF